MPQHRKRPWLILFPLLSFLLVAVLWSSYWFIAIELAKDQFERERVSLSERGLVLDCTQETWGGFPFRFEFNCTSPALHFMSRLEVRSANIMAVALAYNPWQVIVLIDGPTTATGATSLPTRAEHQRAIASIVIDSNNQPSLSVDLPKLIVPGLLTTDRLRFDARPAANAGIELAASIDGLNYQPTGRPELLIRRGDLRGSFFQDGRLSVERIELAEGNVRYWGAGEIQLDQSRRLAGNLSTETNDLNGLLSILDPHLDMTDDQKVGLRTVLGLLGQETKADIIARDGQLFIGPFKIADLVPLY